MTSKTISEWIFDSRVYLLPIQVNILKTLIKQGPMARRDLVKQLKTPRTTIYDNLNKLQKKRVVEKFTRNDGTRGRPLVFWKVKESKEFMQIINQIS